MMADELERRVRTLEEELNGEKHLTRYAVEQTQRNGEVLIALRSDTAALRSEVTKDVGVLIVRVDHLTADMAAVKSAQVMHGRALDVLMQDVRQLRSGQDELNRKQEETSQKVDELSHKQDELNQKVDELSHKQAEMSQKVDELSRKLDLLLAAITPRDPAVGHDAR
jgi:uncharacterized coiled-coil DUF342 family protein